MNLRRLAFYFGVIVVALVANTFVLYQNLERMNEHQYWVNHTNQVIGSLSSIDAKMRSAEAASRGYILAPKEAEFLADFENTNKDISTSIDQLQNLTIDNVAQQPAIQELRKLVEERVNLIQKNIPLIRQGLLKGADVTQVVRSGKTSMDRFSSHLQTMATIENQLLSKRTAEASRSRQLVYGTFGASFLVNLILAMAAFWLFRGQLIAQNKALQEQIYKNWIQDGIGKIGSLLAGQITPEKVGERALNFFTQIFKIPAGKFFALQDGYLDLLAAHAGPLRDSGITRYKLGEGLIGTAAKSTEIHEINEIPQGYFPIGSSLGASTPQVLSFVPLSFQGITIGIIEFAAFSKLTPRELDLLTQVQERIGIVLNAALNLRKQTELLEETQRQSEELQAQQEELRTNNEELEEQANALLRSQERQHAQQEELRQINEELEAQTRTLEHQQEVVGQRNIELEAARRETDIRANELERTNQYKSEFLAKMSHELRTPLNSMLILSSLLSENKDRNLSAQQVEFSETIHDAGSDLLNLINDILDLSKLEARKLLLRADPFAVQSLVDSIDAQFAPLLKKKNVALKVTVAANVPGILRTDRQRIEQVLRNFLSNAAKFTDKGEVKLTIRRSDKGHNLIRFEVKDTGIGIAPEKKQKIFDAFEQVDSSISRKYGGTGLGLTISRELALLLQGRIEVESEENVGSTFALEIPAEIIVLDQSGGGAGTPPKPVEEDFAPKLKMAAAEAIGRRNVDDLLVQIRERVKGEARSLLIVEDDSAFVKALENSALSHGFTPITVEDGETAFELLKQYVPAAILLDIKLPGISGMTVLERIKQKSELRHIPIHMISGLEYQIPALRLGAVGYLGKPVSMEGIKTAFDKIERMLDKKVKQVLIVEDDGRQVKAMQQLLSGPGVQIVAAHSAKEALSQISELEFECIIVDLSLPDTKDFELLEQIHAELGENVPPIIIYTGRDLTREEEERLRSFSESIIIKGAKSPERLLDEVNLFLHRVESELPEGQRSMLSELRMREKSFDGRSVLLVDDDLRNIFALTSALESKGLKVVAARNGFEALEALEKNPEVDAVLMDIMMPKMDGFEAIRRIRQLPDFKNLPIIALTAKAMKGDQEKCIEAGANDYMPKPVNLMNLISVLKVWMTGKKAWT